MIRIALPVLTLLLVLVPAARADEAAVTRRATELRESAGEQGRSIAALPAQAALTRTSERQGPWVRVRTTTGATGWVHLFDIGPATAAAPADNGGGVVGSALRGVTGLFGGNRPQQTATTAGIRGLGAEDLAQASPNPAAVAQMEGLRQTEADARAFADAAALRAVVVAPLAAAAPAASPAAGGNPQQSP